MENLYESKLKDINSPRFNENDLKIKSKIIFVKSKKEDDLTVDAINYYVSNLDSCKHLKYINYFYIDNDQEFLVNENIYCRARGKTNEKEEVSYSLELYSYNLQLKCLKKFVEELKEKYIFEQNNKLGNKKFYFDEHHVNLMKNQDNSIKFSTAPNELSFKMTQFNTNKSLKNVFGKHLDVVKERIDLFCNHPEWYEEKGIPYTLGILLHGPAGTGKTSLIKALAGDTKRHIFNIKLLPDTTQTQLNNLFFNERVRIIRNGNTEFYNIPLDNRIYVMEDIDCNNDILLDRKYRSDLNEDKSKQNDYSDYNCSFEANYDQIHNVFSNNFGNYENSNKNKTDLNDLSLKKNLQNLEEDNNEQVTLSFLLNLLDGILETPGRILIMTSNYPDKLDQALIRPGRIDINLEVGYCNTEMINDMFKYFYKSIDTNNFKFDGIEINSNITPAQLNQILLNNFNNCASAFNEIKDFISNSVN